MLKKILFPLCLVPLATAAWAADPVTDAVQKTYAPYRVALFKTNAKAQEDSRQAVLQARQGWARIVTDYGKTPPPPYAADAGFAASLAAVDTVYAKALEAIGRNELVQAHDTLEEVRDLLAELRRRNQIVVFSDHVNAYHEVMEHVLTHGEHTLVKANGSFELIAEVGALDYLAARLKSEAPAELASNEDFRGLQKAIEKSVADLKAALFAQDAARVKEMIGKLKAPFSKLFVKFG